MGSAHTPLCLTQRAQKSPRQAGRLGSSTRALDSHMGSPVAFPFY